MVIRSRNSRRV